jgi:hypothetical protein
MVEVTVMVTVTVIPVGRDMGGRVCGSRSHRDAQLQPIQAHYLFGLYLASHTRISSIALAWHRINIMVKSTTHILYAT